MTEFRTYGDGTIIRTRYDSPCAAMCAIVRNVLKNGAKKKLLDNFEKIDSFSFLLYAIREWDGEWKLFSFRP